MQKGFTPDLEEIGHQVELAGDLEVVAEPVSAIAILREKRQL